jgi:cytochrome bd-type quinol oxidase subunit 1
VAQAVAQAYARKQGPHTLGGAIKAIGENPLNPIGRLRLERPAFELLIGLGKGCRTRLLRIGGWPDEAAAETRYAIEIPKGLSLLAFHNPNAEVKGLEAFQRRDWPPVAVVPIAFQVMVGLGSFMALVAAWALALMARGRDLSMRRWLLRALVAAASMGFICTEAGWVVTEVGRQPWVIYGVLRTAEAVTPMPGLVVPFATFTLLYCFLGFIAAWLLWQQVLRSPTGAGGEMRIEAHAKEPT